MQHALSTLASDVFARYNVSVSVAVKLDEGAEFSASQGHGDFDAKSRIPSGSAVKPFIAASLLQFAVAGRLDINAPAAQTLDRWRANQSLPPLGE